MRLDFTALPPRDAYAWMISTILPRPIAWVSTISADGKTMTLTVKGTDPNGKPLNMTLVYDKQ